MKIGNPVDGDDQRSRHETINDKLEEEEPQERLTALGLLGMENPIERPKQQVIACRQKASNGPVKAFMILSNDAAQCAAKRVQNEIEAEPAGSLEQPSCGSLVDSHQQASLSAIGNPDVFEVRPDAQT
jgi:hypothetical protein